ncbi:MAG TPA: hypothetical protein VFC68_00925 [Treponemataceae bacterium]|nr:hypothetical protein [Treponemataceae bacterium]
MARKTTPLEKARKALNRHRFTAVVKILEPFVIDYRESFDFHYILGTACLYLGDIGGAELYYKRARRIKITDPNLINAQAVLFLRRGEVDKAVEYYLEAQEYDPTNATAQKGLDFIRKNSSPERIQAAIINNTIENLYPRCANSPLSKIALSAAVFITIFIVSYYFVFPRISTPKMQRADLTDLVLTIEDQRNSLETDLTTSKYRYILSAEQITSSYAKAQKYFQNYRDNAAQVEVNRILNSNASAAVRQKTRLLMEYFEKPGFDTITDVYTYKEVAEEPYLYLDCWVVWSGRITNAKETTYEYYCDFLVGYDSMKQMDGLVPLVLEQPVVINTTQPLTVLAKIGIQNNKIFLKGSSIYQSIKNK